MVSAVKALPNVELDRDAVDDLRRIVGVVLLAKAHRAAAVSQRCHAARVGLDNEGHAVGWGGASARGKLEVKGGAERPGTNQRIVEETGRFAGLSGGQPGENRAGGE